MREEYWHIIAASGSVSLLTIIQTGRAAQSCPAQPLPCSHLKWGLLGDGDGGGGDGVDLVPVGRQTMRTVHW